MQFHKTTPWYYTPDDQVLASLVSILRSAVGSLVRKEAREFTEATESLGTVDRTIRELDWRESYRLNELRNTSLIAEIEALLQDSFLETNRLLRAGDIRRARETLASGAGRWGVRIPEHVPEEIGGPIVRCGKTLRKLHKLSATSIQKHKHIRSWSKNKSCLTQDQPFNGSIQTRVLTNCDFRDKLESILEESIKRFWSFMPNIEIAAVAEAQNRRAALEIEIGTIEIERAPAQADEIWAHTSVVAELMWKQMPSFSSLVAKQIGRGVVAKRVLADGVGQSYYPTILAELAGVQPEGVMTNVLWLSANPPAARSLDLEEEIHLVENQLQAAKYRRTHPSSLRKMQFVLSM